MEKHEMTIPMPDLLDYAPVSLQDKNILISGGTTGIGRTTALLLAAQGAQVMIFGRHQQELDDTLHDFEKAGLEEQVQGLLGDMANNEDIQKIFAEADQEFDNLDVLINNASLAFDGIMEGRYKDWEYIVQTNLLGYMSCTREAIERMKVQGGGHIVNIGSMSANSRGKDSSVYVATKAGIQGFSESVSKEVREFGIRVSLIEPGAVGTDMQPVTPEEQRKKEEEKTMLKAEDIAACVLYTLTQPARCNIDTVRIVPHMQDQSK